MQFKQTKFLRKKTEIQTLPNSEMKFLLCVFAIFYRHKKNASNFVEYRYFSDYLKYDTNIQTNSETANETTLTRRAFTQSMLLYFAHTQFHFVSLVHIHTRARMLNDFQKAHFNVD